MSAMPAKSLSNQSSDKNFHKLSQAAQSHLCQKTQHQVIMSGIDIGKL